MLTLRIHARIVVNPYRNISFEISYEYLKSMPVHIVKLCLNGFIRLEW